MGCCFGFSRAKIASGVMTHLMHLPSRTHPTLISCMLGHVGVCPIWYSTVPSTHVPCYKIYDDTLRPAVVCSTGNRYKGIFAGSLYDKPENQRQVLLFIYFR